MRNHLGQYECRLCLTLHNNEGNYLAHTQVSLPKITATLAPPVIDRPVPAVHVGCHLRMPDAHCVTCGQA